jgi:hypothetical protein
VPGSVGASDVVGDAGVAVPTESARRLSTMASILPSLGVVGSVAAARGADSACEVDNGEAGRDDDFDVMASRKADRLV